MELHSPTLSSRVRALILCGGLGTRLRPILADRPKSMALVAGVPFLQLLIERVRSEGVQEIILGTGYMADLIEKHFAGGHNLGISIRYSREREPLGTGGAVKLAESQLSDPVLILNGDSYAEWRLGPILELMVSRNADLVMVLQKVGEVTRYGSVTLGHDNRVTRFVEKGRRHGGGLVNAGVYLLRKQIVRNLPARSAVSLEREVFPRLLDGKVYGWVSEGTFIDIGIPEDLLRAQTLLPGVADTKPVLRSKSPEARRRRLDQRPI